MVPEAYALIAAVHATTPLPRSERIKYYTGLLCSTLCCSTLLKTLRAYSATCWVPVVRKETCRAPFERFVNYSRGADFLVGLCAVVLLLLLNAVALHSGLSVIFAALFEHILPFVPCKVEVHLVASTIGEGILICTPHV